MDESPRRMPGYLHTFTLLPPIPEVSDRCRSHAVRLWPAALTAAAAVTITVVVWPEVSDTGRQEGTAGASTPSHASPSPTRSYPLSVAPRTIPAVREHIPARGPGWRPGPTSAVVTGDGSGALADEAQLLAKELKISYRGAVPARAGDVELALGTPGKGAPESYTLRTHDGRVTITGPDQAGVFYGTRTLKQALRADGTMPEGEVRDRPDRPQRGLNLDIARKYYSVGWIEDRLREMADLKLNQLGLHFSDDQAFRIQSDTHPEVVSPEHLTKAEVRQILALAGQAAHRCGPRDRLPGPSRRRPARPPRTPAAQHGGRALDRVDRHLPSRRGETHRPADRRVRGSLRR